jgi:hypothetical protein
MQAHIALHTFENGPSGTAVGVLTVAGEQSSTQAGDGLCFESSQKHGLKNTRLAAQADRVRWTKAG